MPLALVRSLTLVAALFVLPASALAVDCGDTIPAGSNIQLQKGVDFTSTQCTASGVALTIEGPAKVDMGGIRIIGDGGSFDDGILLTGSKVKLSNGGVVNFGRGVTLAGDGGHSITNFGVTNTPFWGFRLDSDRNKLKQTVATRAGDGYVIEGSGNKLIGVIATDNVRGIWIYPGPGREKNLITKSSISASSQIGIRIDSVGNSVSKNTVSGWVSDGILLDTTASGNKVQKNLLAGGDFSSGQGEAIHALAGSADNQITKNISLASQVFNDLEDDNPDCGTNRWTKNIFKSGTPSSCIE